MQLLRRILISAVLLLFTILLNAQQVDSGGYRRCGTTERLENRFLKNPAARILFEEQQELFNKIVREKNLREPDESARTIYTIPVVFHVVLTNQSQVTDAQIQAQLDTLNKSMAGLNGDSIRIPSWFKALFGKSGIQFCLAQRTPDNRVSSGIERITTTQTNFSNNNDFVKRSATGGANIWDQTRYLNVWVCGLTGSILGYATYPTDFNPEEQGIVIDYRSLPGGNFTNYNTGKTLVHEAGHYFNLVHIWGNNDNSCSDSDFVDDTPNQDGATNGCFTGAKLDDCNLSGNGIMYQNYMDYSYDACLVMFSNLQVIRMENALSLYRSSLLSSNGCEPVVDRVNDARLLSIDAPLQRLCDNTFTPAVTIRNEGSQTVTSLVINARIDNGAIASFNWTGSLTSLTNTTVTLNKLTTPTGRHTLTVYITGPGNTSDQLTDNDTLSLSYQYNLPVSEVAEGFEGGVFPPDGWDIVNTDNGIQWQRITGLSNTGSASAMVNNFNYVQKGEKDDLRLPNLALANIDSSFLSFSVAASGTTAVPSQPASYDTLEVLVSGDCGASFNSIYKKWGADLNTRVATSASEFSPSASEWKKDSVNLSPYINAGIILVAFRSTNGYQNNIYLDDINLRNVIVNPILKQRGILITPNPAREEVAVRFYPQPVTLRGIQLFNIMGQKLAEVRISDGATNNFYSFNMRSYAAGTYIVRVVFADSVVTRKIIKL